MGNDEVTKFTGNNPLPKIIKSPSDTTIYAPALKKISESNQASNVIDKISNFVEIIRMEADDNCRTTPQKRAVMVNPVMPLNSAQNFDPQPGCSGMSVMRRKEQYTDEDIRPALEKADKLVLDAERLKASLVAPQGTCSLPIKIDHNIELLWNLDNDNNVFHVECHIDENLKFKIQKGEFVELKRLLPKERSFAGHSMEDGTAVQLYTKNGQAFFALPESHGIKRWDQAFRVYTTIYSQVNPKRAGEIWQYIHLIHTAAASYSWSNVAYYNFTFQHWMASKPWRSWSKTYT